MPIKNIVTGVTGLAGVNPNVIYIETTDTLATVTTAGYLNNAHRQGYVFGDKQAALVTVVATPGAAPDVVLLNVSVSGSNYSLVGLPGSGDVVLPTVANRLVHFSDTLGTMTDAAANVINLGNIQAGQSGTAGTLLSFPLTAARGALILAGVANVGNTNVTISNASHAQASVYSIPDVGAATGQFNVVTGALTSGNLMMASGTAGKLADSTIAATAVQLKANIKAATTANIGGAGAGPITVAVAGLTAASVVVATVEASSNPVSVIACTAGVAGFDVTFSADPGATCTLNYVAFIAAQ